MWRNISRCCLAALIIVATTASVQAQSPELSRLRAALGDLTSYLNRYATGQSWQDYLHLAELQQQMARGNNADVSALAPVMHRFSTRSPVLNRPRYARVKAALIDWVAGLPGMSLENLPEVVRGQKEFYIPTTEAEVLQARRTVLEAAQALNAYLSTPGENKTAWKNHLELASLIEFAQGQGAPSEEEFELVDRAFTRLDRNQEDLNRPEFAALRSALKTFRRRADVFYSQDPAGYYRETLDILADALEAYQQDPGRKPVSDIQSSMFLLQSEGLAPHIVRAVYSQLSHTNLVVEIGEEVIAASVARPVNDVAPVRDIILGSYVTGTAHTVGRISAELVPNPRVAEINVQFYGRAHSRSVARQDRATVYSNSVTNLSAQKRLYVDDDGWTTAPAYAYAHTSTHITGVHISAHLFKGIAQRIGWQEVMKRKPASEREAARLARGRLARRLNEDIETELANNRQGVAGEFRDTLERRGHRPRYVHYSTTADTLRVQAEHAPPGTIAAPTPPPEVPGYHALSVRLHESAIENAAETALGGETLTRQEWEEMQAELKLEPGEEEIEGDWKVGFPRVRPVEFRVTEPGFQLTLHMDGYRFGATDGSGEQWDVTVNYRMQITPEGGLLLEREGDIVVLPARLREMPQGGLNAVETAKRRRILRAYEKVFPESRTIASLEPPGNLDKVGPLYWTGMQRLPQRGWLWMTWRR